MKSIIALLVMVFGLSLLQGEEAGDGLNGKTGKLFKVDPESRTLEFLKETEYDPKTGMGKSRFTIRWADDVEILEMGELKNFTSLKEPVVASFHGIDEANAAALQKGESFEARVATLYFGAGDEVSLGIDEDGRKVTGRLTPSGKGEARVGMLSFDDKQVPVSLRKKFWRIFYEKPLKPEDLTKGFWMATLGGKEDDGAFIADRIEVQSLPDPRKTDDPELPRVLVIGDSISMNYHDAAKEALKGVANYHRNEGNSFSSAHGVANSELWLGDYKKPGFQWDVIQFNHGLHDLKQTYDKATDSFGDYAVSLDDYMANLEKQIRILKKTGAKLIWCSTTPVPKDNKSQYARRSGAAREFNAAALEVMKKHPEIIVNDLQTIIDESPVFDAWRKQNDVHFYKPEEQKVLGEAVADAVKRALGE